METWFIVSMITLIALFFSWVLFGIGHVMSNGIALDVIKAKMAGGRAVIMPDNSGVACLLRGKFTGSHLETKYGEVRWTPGSFNFYGLQVGVGDPDLGTTIPAHMAARLERLKKYGFNGIKEASAAYELLSAGLNLATLKNRITELEAQMKSTQEPKLIEYYRVQHTQAHNYIGIMEKVETNGLTLMDFENIEPVKNELMDFRGLYEWVNYHINPKWTQLATSAARLDERENLNQSPFDGMKGFMGVGIFLFLIMLGVYLLTSGHSTAVPSLHHHIVSAAANTSLRM